MKYNILDMHMSKITTKLQAKLNQPVNTGGEVSENSKE
jgi:hypothetical protein